MQRAQSFKTVSTIAGFPDASALSAYSVVKLNDMLISLDFPIVPCLANHEITRISTIFLC